MPESYSFCFIEVQHTRVLFIFVASGTVHQSIISFCCIYVCNVFQYSIPELYCILFCCFWVHTRVSHISSVASTQVQYTRALFPFVASVYTPEYYFLCCINVGTVHQSLILFCCIWVHTRVLFPLLHQRRYSTPEPYSLLLHLGTHQSIIYSVASTQVQYTRVLFSFVASVYTLEYYFLLLHSCRYSAPEFYSLLLHLGTVHQGIISFCCIYASES